MSNRSNERFRLVGAALIFSLSVGSFVKTVVYPNVAYAFGPYEEGCGIGPFCESDYGPCLGQDYFDCAWNYYCASSSDPSLCMTGAADYCFSVC